ncbi:YbaY family lipoprotein [Pseudomonas citronellolis]|uniref:YbaY family lipoprotein n=1 Tax=Pseudomonas citronellolis TaxID=53408 RepID=UPI0023E460B3|nr:YbaY family lipoprotein [Pseudomonas citronellolis]MDF3931512.1 YbaY family lipoprotein [Pseudomonas citronellolis]
MPLRLICLFALALLAACSSKQPAPQQTAANAPAKVAVTPLAANQRELSGLITSSRGALPDGAEVELALLLMDERDRPQRALASLDLVGNGGALPFSLRYDPSDFPAGGRIELHVRGAQNGQLAWRLRPLTIAPGQSQALGELRLEPAP